MKLSAVATSSAPVNNSPLSSLNPVDPAQALNSVTNQLAFFTRPATDTNPPVLFQTKVNGNTFTWQNSNSPSAILAALTAATPAGKRVYNSFNPITQVVTLVRSGDPAFNAGTNTAANPMSSISVVDTTGNLSRFFNFDTTLTAQGTQDQEVTSLSVQVSVEGTAKVQAKSLVDATATLQTQQSGVDLNAEMARAAAYQRSYQAAVRLQYIIDDMLNVLINRTGSSSSLSSAL